MMNLVPKTNIDFLKYRKVFLGIAAVCIIASIIAVAVRGLNLGIDFKGGTMLQVQFNQPTTIDQVRNALDKINPEIQSYVGKNLYAVKVKGSQENVNEVSSNIESSLKAAGLDFTVESVDFVGPTVGKDLAKNAVLALVLSLVFMVIYIAFRFQNIVWGSSGVLALVHDAIIMVGVFAVMYKEVDLIIVAALLTAIGYSINDNIVIFDRMRENIKNNPKLDLYTLINRSINETLSRTVITGSTVFVAVVIIYFFGGEVLRNFALIMIIGIVVGTYSTIAVASMLVYEWVKNVEDASHLVENVKTEKVTHTEAKKQNKRNRRH
ncbi:preprotein translocase subunit SecF [Elusimicrobium simillimum]|uniref:protein translocase subunit SecF n=1 Tax=Elusimicrobium simillimum TaxID=3143438 RepID=UPI003C704CB8